MDTKGTLLPCRSGVPGLMWIRRICHNLSVEPHWLRGYTEHTIEWGSLSALFLTRTRPQTKNLHKPWFSHQLKEAKSFLCIGHVWNRKVVYINSHHAHGHACIGSTQLLRVAWTDSVILGSTCFYSFPDFPTFSIKISPADALLPSAQYTQLDANPDDWDQYLMENFYNSVLSIAKPFCICIPHTDGRGNQTLMPWHSCSPAEHIQV